MFNVIKRTENRINQIFESGHVAFCDNISIDLISTIIKTIDKISQHTSCMFDLNEHPDKFKIDYCNHLIIRLDYEYLGEPFFDADAVKFNKDGTIDTTVVTFTTDQNGMINYNRIAEDICHEFCHCKECIDININYRKYSKFINFEMPNVYKNKYFSEFSIPNKINQIMNDLRRMDIHFLLYYIFIKTEKNALCSQLYGDLYSIPDVYKRIKNIEQNQMTNSFKNGEYSKNYISLLKETMTYSIYEYVRDAYENKIKNDKSNTWLKIIKNIFIDPKTNKFYINDYKKSLTEQEFIDLFKLECEKRLSTVYRNFGTTLSMFIQNINQRKDYFTLTPEERKEIYHKDLDKLNKKLIMKYGVEVDFEQYDEDIELTYTCYKINHLLYNNIDKSRIPVINKMIIDDTYKNELESFKVNVKWNKKYDKLNEVINKHKIFL